MPPYHIGQKASMICCLANLGNNKTNHMQIGLLKSPVVLMKARERTWYDSSSRAITAPCEAMWLHADSDWWWRRRAKSESPRPHPVPPSFFSFQKLPVGLLEISTQSMRLRYLQQMTINLRSPIFEDHLTLVLLVVSVREVDCD